MGQEKDVDNAAQFEADLDFSDIGTDPLRSDENPAEIEEHSF